MIQAKVPEGLPKWMSEHVDSYLKSGGKDGHMYTIKPPGTDKEITVPALLLVTKGRKSGEKYLFPLFYGDTGKASYYLIASKGGSPAHPSWYLNLLGNPRAQIQVKAEKMEVTARIAEGEERERLWRDAAQVWPNYDVYVTRTTRRIPVVVLEPVRR